MKMAWIPIPHLFVRRPPDQATSWHRKQENKFNYFLFSELDITKGMTHLSLKEVPNVNLSRLTHDVLISLKCYPVYVPKYAALGYDSLPIG